MVEVVVGRVVVVGVVPVVEGAMVDGEEVTACCWLQDAAAAAFILAFLVLKRTMFIIFQINPNSCFFLLCPRTTTSC